MKYTFLLPTFKATYFREALESIKNQTYRDFKVIVSDDCSPEGKQLKQIYEAVADVRFTFRRNTENMGSKSLVSHWNLLVDLCDTDYLIMASDDDVYESTFLEEINRLVEKYPDCDLFRGRVQFIDDKGNTLNKDNLMPEYENNIEFLRSHFSDGNLKCIANHVFCTNILRDKGGFEETPLAWYSDQITAIKGSSNGCANTPNVVFNFRMSDQNISGRKPTKRVASLKAKATMQADRWFSKYLQENNIKDFQYKRWGKQIYYWLMNADFKTYISLLPEIIRYGLWDKKWMEAITRHQIKMLLTNG